MEKESISKKAVTCGSDLRKLTGREMLGSFIAARGRYYDDTGKLDLAAHDYALAYMLAPSNRRIYVGLVGNLMEIGEQLFASNEQGHPVSLAMYLMRKYQPIMAEAAISRRPVYQPDPREEVDRINAMNRANMERMMQPPQRPQSHQPTMQPQLEKVRR